MTGSALPRRRLQIEFLFLDLETCQRCEATDATLVQALELVRPALDATGVEVTVNKTPIIAEQQARAIGFVTSPTILINGVDIAGELLESACDPCGDESGADIECRDWIYQGERSTEPPVGLIVEAIMRHAFAATPSADRHFVDPYSQRDAETARR